jgi:S1-C subfamily serine protease
MAAVLICLLLLGGAATTIRGQVVRDRNHDLHRIAEAGNKGVVAIYCMRDEWETYYGTGTVISPDGYILTSTTVVPEGVTNIFVHFTDLRVLEAKVVEINEALECTLLKVEGRDFSFLPVASELPSVGDPSYTLGNAEHSIRLNGAGTFSTGVVSGVYEVKSADSQSTYAGLAIETTAAINPGQDGGPLINARGQVVGMLSLSFSESRWQGMAVPMSRLLEGMKTLRDGKVRLNRGQLVKPLTDRIQISAHAASRAASLVSIQVQRAYPSETLPMVTWPAYRQSLDNWAEMSPQQKMRIQSECSLAEITLNANRMLRRPDEAVTGVLISADGYILTSAFNVGTDTVFKPKKGEMRPVEYDGNLTRLLTYDDKENMAVANPVKSVTVTLKDGREFPAKIVARHQTLGVALLKIKAKDLPFLDLAASVGEARLGDSVGVLGISAGKGQSYTLNNGIVSADNRNKGLRFQMTAMVNYGNSGGLVINSEGRVLGVVLDPLRAGPRIQAKLGMEAYPKAYGPMTGRMLPVGGRNQDLTLALWQIAPNSGIGFAAPMAKIMEDLPELMTGKDITKTGSPYIGIQPAMNANNLFKDEIVVGTVIKGSPAEQSGMKTGDTIVRVNDQPVQNWKEFADLIDELVVGDTIEVTLRRKGGPAHLEIKGEKVTSAADLKKLMDSLKDGEEFSGRKVSTSDEEIKLRMELGEQP